MALVVCIHSFRGGTGKSNTTANLAALLAQGGQRVAVVDTDIQSPGVHALFGLDERSVRHAINEYLWGECEIAAAAHDVTAQAGNGVSGRVFLVPASLRAGDIARVLHDGYDVDQLHSGFETLIAELGLDALLIDTHPGLNEETLLSVALSDAMLILLRPDQQDYQGTAVTVQVAGRLAVPRMLLLVNKAPASLDPVALAQQVERTYGCPVVGVLPHSDELMGLGSGALLVARFPDHPVATTLRRVVDALVAGG